MSIIIWEVVVKTLYGRSAGLPKRKARHQRLYSSKTAAMVLLHFKVRHIWGSLAAHQPLPWARCSGLSAGALARMPRPACATATEPRARAQNSEADQFLFETSVSRPAGDVAFDLAELHNLRHRITRLKLEGGELAKYGPAKAPDQQGIDQFQEGAAAREHGPHYCMDPTGRRTGEGELSACSGRCVLRRRLLLLPAAAGGRMQPRTPSAQCLVGAMRLAAPAAAACGASQYGSGSALQLAGCRQVTTTWSQRTGP